MPRVRKTGKRLIKVKGKVRRKSKERINPWKFKWAIEVRNRKRLESQVKKLKKEINELEETIEDKQNYIEEIFTQ